MRLLSLGLAVAVCWFAMPLAAEEPVPADAAVAERFDLDAVIAEREKRLTRLRVRPRTDRRLNEAKLAFQAEDFTRARAAIGKLRFRALNTLERAQAYQMLGYLDHATGDTKSAIANLGKAIEQESLSIQDEAELRYSIAQMHAELEEWKKVPPALNTWFRYVRSPSPRAYYLLAVAHYQLDEYAKALIPANQAVENSPQPAEAWLQLLAALHLELEQYADLQLVLEQLVLRYPTKRYWLQLGHVFSALENYRNSLAVQQLAYAQGFLTEDEELRRLATTYLYHEIPYQAAVLLEQEMAAERIEEDPESLEMLSNAWIASREYKKAVPPLERAAQQAEEGELFVRLAQVQMQIDEWVAAAEALDRGLKKGVDDPGNAHLLRGIAFYNAERPDRARPAFQRALRFEKKATEAQAWLKLMDREAAQNGQPTSAGSPAPAAEVARSEG